LGKYKARRQSVRQEPANDLNGFDRHQSIPATARLSVSKRHPSIVWEPQSAETFSIRYAIGYDKDKRGSTAFSFSAVPGLLCGARPWPIEVSS